MDFSTEYVMMCQASAEVQEMAKHREITQKDFMAKHPDHKDAIWLPRADQFEETILCARNGSDEPLEEYTNHDIGRLCEDLHGTIVNNPATFTMEQVYLCLFMRELYFKTWNVKDKKWETR